MWPNSEPVSREIKVTQEPLEGYIVELYTLTKSLDIDLDSQRDGAVARAQLLRGLEAVRAQPY